MPNLDIHVHNIQEISVMCEQEQLNISEFQWDPLFDLLLKEAESVFFFGFRKSYFDEPELFIDYLADEVLFNDEDDFEKILLRVKPINIMNRNLLNKLWKCYDSPSLIFLTDKTKEQSLVGVMNFYKINDNIINEIPSVCILYQGIEEDVLWIRSNMELEPIIAALNSAD